MELVRNNWNSNDYREFINYLFSIRDIKYRDFHSSLNVGNEVIGIRTPDIKKMAKEISKGNYTEFLSLIENNYYEEITLYGFIICNIKDLDVSKGYLDMFKYKINNWASCDLFCSSYKIVKKNKDYYYNYIKGNIGSDNMWVRRLCFVLLLDYYVEEEYLGDIFCLCDKYNTSDYYVNMAVAWLISICWNKYRDITLKYILNNSLDDFTFNKTISKIRDSYRVSKEDKVYLNSLKR